jgi:DNA-binding SARP family transcriptional activator
MYAGKEEEARALFPEGTTSAQVENSFLSVYAETGNWTKVVSILKNLIAAEPANMELRMNLVAAYFQGGNRQAAIATIREMIALSPDFRAQGEEYIRQIQATP